MVTSYLIAYYIPTPWVFVAIIVQAFTYTFVLTNSYWRPAVLFIQGNRMVSTEVPNHLHEMNFPKQRNGEQVEKEEGEDNAS